MFCFYYIIFLFKLELVMLLFLSVGAKTSKYVYKHCPFLVKISNKSDKDGLLPCNFIIITYNYFQYSSASRVISIGTGV